MVVRTLLRGVAALCIVASAYLLSTAVPPAAAPPAYRQRQAAVESAFLASREALQRVYDALLASLRRDAPALAPKLLPQLVQAAPKPVPHGYQVLPKLLPDPPPPAERPRAQAKCYSWPWTAQLIERQMQKIAALQADLARAAKLSPPRRDGAYDALVAAYRAVAENQRTIDAHIHYNRLWQEAIAADTRGYDQETVLCHAVLERQAIHDALAAGTDGAFRAAVREVTISDITRPREALEPALRERDEILARQIHAAAEHFTPPAFLRVERTAAHRWVLTVPVYTDIVDAAFVEAFKSAVERAWQTRAGDDEFRIEVAIATIAAARLYAPQSPPTAGQAIDLDAHCARFPRDGAVLTTGADSTHVVAGRCIGVGPHDIAAHTLAHEFGHALGFRDVYFRGYRDLGSDGYEVMEVVADPDDIMGNPGSGPVLPRHFAKLLGNAATSAPCGAGP